MPRWNGFLSNFTYISGIEAGGAYSPLKVGICENFGKNFKRQAKKY